MKQKSRLGGKVVAIENNYGQSLDIESPIRKGRKKKKTRSRRDMDKLGWKVATMLAARAGSLRTNIDFNKPIIEFKYMKLTTVRQRRRFTTYYDSYKLLLQIPSSLQGADSATISDVVRARHEAAVIMENISKQDGYRNKEIYLLREFLYHNFSAFHQSFIRKLLFDEYDLMANDKFDQFRSRIDV